MSPPAPATSRTLKHRRSIDVEVYARDDGLWEAEARLVDVRPRDVAMSEGLRPAGTPIHDLRLRVVVDTALNIVAAGSESVWVPYRRSCGEHAEAYGRLVGLNLARGFRRAVAERVGGVQGCTHLTELAQVLPTAVIQAFAGEVIDTRGDADRKPFQIDRCHARRSDGEVVRVHHPRWYRQPGAKNSEHNSPADAGCGPR